LRMAGGLHQSLAWLVRRAVTSETLFLGISGIASIPVLGKSVFTGGLAGALYQVGSEGRLTACCCRDKLDVPRSRYAEVTALG
jgi:hypothetical protein